MGHLRLLLLPGYRLRWWSPLLLLLQRWWPRLLLLLWLLWLLPRRWLRLALVPTPPVGVPAVPAP